jgi:hypothetical protein
VTSRERSEHKELLDKRDGDAWRIDRFAFHLKFIDGNEELESS